MSLLGAFLIGVLPQPVLKLILGIFLITTSTSFLIMPGLKIPANTGTFVAGGSATGFITALVGTGGALRATLLQGFNIEKIRYIATTATIALATDVTRTNKLSNRYRIKGDFRKLFLSLYDKHLQKEAINTGYGQCSISE